MMNKGTINKNTTNTQLEYDRLSCAIPDVITTYNDLMKHVENEMTKMCGIPKELLEIEKKSKSKNKW